MRHAASTALSSASLALLTASLAQPGWAQAALPAAAVLLLASLLLPRLARPGTRRSLGEVSQRACSVCGHPRRVELESRIVGGAALGEVAAEYGLELEELATHLTLHQRGPAGGEGGKAKIDVEAELNKLLQELKEMYASLKGLDEDQLRVQDYLRIVSERRGLLRDIRLLVLLLAGLGPGRGGGKDLGALVRILRRLGSPAGDSPA